MKRMRLLTVLILTLALVALAGCGSSGGGGDKIKVAVVAPLTGDSAALGEDFVNGARLAAEVYNSREGKLLGKTVEIVPMDDQADPKQAPVVAQKLVDEGVHGVVGHFTSGTTIPTTGIYARAHIPQVTPASNPKVTDQGFDNVFRITADDTFQGTAMAKYAMNQLGQKKFAVIHDKEAFGQGVAEQFARVVEADGGTITSINGVTTGDVEFKALLTKIKGEAPEAIYFGGTFKEGGLILKQMRELGIDAQFLAPDLVRNEEFFKTAGDAAEGAIVSFPSPPESEVPELNQFKAEYKQAYSKDPIVGQYGYDAAMIILQAIEQAGTTDGVKVIETLHKGTFKAAISQAYQWDEKGNLTGGEGFPVYQARGSQWEYLGRF